MTSISFVAKKIAYYRLVIGSGLFLAFVFWQGTPLWATNAREINQTIPTLTPTPLPTLVPTATSTPQIPTPDSGGGNSGGGNNNQSSSQPTNTAEATKQTAQKLTGTVKPQTLNVRSGPGTGYLVIGGVKQGEKVEILEQNAAGTWWRICCISGSDLRGWVNAAFIEPDFALSDAAKLIPQTAEVPATATAEPTEIAATQAITQATTAQPADAVTQTIKVQIEQSPAFPLQGTLVTWLITVSNPTQTDAIDVELRDELPTEMSIVTIATTEQALVQQDITENLRQVYSILWPSIPAGKAVTATVQTLIDPNLADGTVLDNLAYAGGVNVPGSTAGLSIGMPPLDLPDFQ